MLWTFLTLGDSLIVSGWGAEVKFVVSLCSGFMSSDWKTMLASTWPTMLWWVLGRPPHPSVLAFTCEAMVAAMKFSKAHVMTNTVEPGQPEEEVGCSSPLHTPNSHLSEVELEWCEAKKGQKAVCVSCVQLTQAGKVLCKKCFSELAAVSGNPGNLAGGAASWAHFALCLPGIVVLVVNLIQFGFTGLFHMQFWSRLRFELCAD